MSKIAIVTGANQGLGFALAEGLARRLDREDVVYLTGRDHDRVRSAAARIAGARAQVRGEVLDVRDGAAVTAFADEIAARHGGIDIVFSNAAARLTPGDALGGAGRAVRRHQQPRHDAHAARLRSDPAPRAGGCWSWPATSAPCAGCPRICTQRFDTDAMSLDDVDTTMLAWRDAVVDGLATEEGWPEWINIPSKVGQVAAVRVLARERRAADAQDGTLVAAICPGLVDTQASRPWFEDMGAAQTPAAGRASPRCAWRSIAATDRSFYGELVQFGEVIPWR